MAVKKPQPKKTVSEPKTDTKTKSVHADETHNTPQKEIKGTEIQEKSAETTDEIQKNGKTEFKKILMRETYVGSLGDSFGVFERGRFYVLPEKIAALFVKAKAADYAD